MKRFFLMFLMTEEDHVIVDHAKADSDKTVTWSQTHNDKYGDRLGFLFIFFALLHNCPLPPPPSLNGKAFGEFALL